MLEYERKIKLLKEELKVDNESDSNDNIRD